jgi:hypothetical protein
MTEHPQTPINPEGLTADEKIAPLVNCARRHGLGTNGSCQGGGDGDYALAYISFLTAREALEFLLQTAELMNYQVGDQIAMTVHRPLVSTTPGGKVIWHPDLTHAMIAAWAGK